MKRLIIYSLIFILCLLFIFNSNSFATSIKNYFLASNSVSNDNITKLDVLSSNIYVLLKAVGIVIASCLSVFFAISYMIATPAKKSELKGRVIYYIAGIILLFGLGAFFTLFEYLASNLKDALQ